MRSEQRYEAIVPDTLDLAERARVAVNALTEALVLDYSPAFCPRYGIMAPWHLGVDGAFGGGQ